MKNNKIKTNINPLDELCECIKNLIVKQDYKSCKKIIYKAIESPSTNDATLIVEMFGMLLGRSEIFIVIIAITFGLKRVKSIFKRKKAV